MTKMKRLLRVITIGGLAGAVLFAWFSPQIIVWYFSPPSGIGLSCKPAVQWAIETYRKVMFSGVLLGAVFSGILYFAFSGRKPSPLGAQDVPPESTKGV